MDAVSDRRRRLTRQRVQRHRGKTDEARRETVRAADRKRKRQNEVVVRGSQRLAIALVSFPDPNNPSEDRSQLQAIFAGVVWVWERDYHRSRLCSATAKLYQSFPRGISVWSTTYALLYVKLSNESTSGVALLPLLSYSLQLTSSLYVP